MHRRNHRLSLTYSCLLNFAHARVFVQREAADAGLNSYVKAFIEKEILAGLLELCKIKLKTYSGKYAVA